MKRLNLYPRSEKVRLVAVVELLCRKLDRPVNSKDLRDYFRCCPDEQPLLMQRLGQQLFKAARPVPVGCPRVWKVGTVDGNAYFAPDAEPVWAEKLEFFRVKCRIREEVRSDILAHAFPLLASPHRKLAEMALWSFHRAWSNTLELPELRNFPPAIRLKLQIREAEETVSIRPDIHLPPEETIDVASARERLRLAAVEWLGEEHASHINYHRYVARCRIGPSRSPCYSASRIDLLASSLWNPDEVDSRLAASLLVCYKYSYRTLSAGEST